MWTMLAVFCAEFIGTALLTFGGIGSAMTTGMTVDGTKKTIDVLTVSAAFGVSVALAVATVGAHANPAVTIGLGINGLNRLSPWLIPVYFAGQFAGGILGVYCLRWGVPGKFAGSIGVHALNPDITYLQCIFLECILSAVLVFSIVTMERHPRNRGVHPLTTAPVAGCVVFIAHVILIRLTGGSINPARSVAAAVVGADYHHLWIFCVGPFLGGLIGGFVGMGIVRIEKHICCGDGTMPIDNPIQIM